MEVLVRNAEGNLSPRDREYAAQKIGHLDRYFHKADKVEIVHRQEKQKHRIEVTVFVDGLTLRGEETDSSMRAAIDLVAHKLENRIKRLKSRLIKSHRHKNNQLPMGLEEIDPQHIEEDDPDDIREHKRFVLRPMSIEDASLQMELLGHDFFVFRNIESHQTEVLYKRKNGGYGLLSPEL